MHFQTSIEKTPLKAPFRIANKIWEATESLVVHICDGPWVGRGEAQGVFYQGETTRSILMEAESIREVIETGIDRKKLQEILPPGGARNAVDCALWDLECKRNATTIWRLLGQSSNTLTTVYTISIQNSPEEMAKLAALASDHSILKVKLDAQEPVARIAAIREARPDAHIIVDVNQAWTFEQLQEYASIFAEYGVQMLEQPLPRGSDECLEGFKPPLPLCADESCLHIGDIDAVRRRYQMVNIKLDKTGGLTGALALAGAAEELGMGLMVGNMMGTSLSMAPSFVIGLQCKYVDLDGPLLLAHDCDDGLEYSKGGVVSPPSPSLWG